jgi:4-carboxymuconolactone decarboxylase
MSTAPEPFELQPEGGWSGIAAPRLLPPPPAQRGLLFRGMSLVARAFGRSEVPDIFSVFHINARLFWAWLFFASRLMPGGRLPPRDREKIILRTAWNCRSRYEWGQHVDIGLRVGLSDAQILAVARGAEACADGDERNLILACDELVRDQCVSDRTWAGLAATRDEKLLIEILILVGHYEMVAGFLNSAGLRLEPPIEARLRAFNQRIAAAAMRTR